MSLSNIAPKLNDPTVSSIPGGLRFLDGLFQASSTRTAGFAVVNLADLHPAIQVSYLIMMYISVFPIAISMRRTNVYEEKSLGIYAPEDENEDGNSKQPSYVGAHLRKQLGFDLWYVFLGLFVIAIVEGNRLQNMNEYSFTLFSVLFEIVSAYGTVGLSLGYPNTNASFSAQFKTLSKLVVIAMQIRGRHRGLPYDLDRAILLPSESLQRKEAEDAERRQLRRRNSVLSRRNSNVSAVSSAVNNRFRQETGLSSGRDDREEFGQGLSKDHHSHVRQGLGSAMARLAEHPETEHPETEKDEKERRD
jgi:Trk-type K+ transport system membrane component